MVNSTSAGSGGSPKRKGTESCRRGETTDLEDSWTKSVTHCKWMGREQHCEREAQKRSEHHRRSRKGQEERCQRKSDTRHVVRKTVRISEVDLDGTEEADCCKRAAIRALRRSCDITCKMPSIRKMTKTLQQCALAT